ncbi:MAG: hypothetical protein WBG50_19390 [Desulfomonilaceae bacterium]
MGKPKIVVVIAIGLIVLSVFCSASFAQDQDQALIEAASNGDLTQCVGWGESSNPICRVEIP